MLETLVRILLWIIGKLVGSRPAPVTVRPSKVLIVDRSFIGDLLMAGVAYQAVKSLFPDAVVRMIGFPVVKVVDPVLPGIDLIPSEPRSGLFAQMRAAWKLRKEKFDVAVHLNTGLHVNFLMWLTGAKLRAGYDYRGRGCFHNIRIPSETRTVRSKYRPEEVVQLLEKAFGWSPQRRTVKLTIPVEAEKSVAEKLAGWGVKPGELLVGIHTNSRQDREIRCWEEGKFAELCNRLIERHRAKVIFTDVEADRKLVEPIWSQIRDRSRVVDAIGATTIPELCALLNRIDLYVSVNTAPMHFAVALGRPLVAILGYAPARIYFPPGNDTFQYVEDPSLAHYDPHRLVQSTPSRIREIPVDDVMAKAEYLLAKRGSARNADGPERSLTDEKR